MKNDKDKIKKQIEEWENAGSKSEFDAPKVWEDILEKQKKTIFIPWYYSAVAGVLFLLLSVGMVVLWLENNDLRQNPMYLSQMFNLQNVEYLDEVSSSSNDIDMTFKPAVIKPIPKLKFNQQSKALKTKKNIHYKTLIKKVEYIPPHLKSEIKSLKQAISKIKEDKEYFENQLNIAYQQITLLKDSVNALNNGEWSFLLAEQTNIKKLEEETLSDIKIHINEMILDSLPIVEASAQTKTSFFERWFPKSRRPVKVISEPLLNSSSLKKKGK